MKKKITNRIERSGTMPWADIKKLTFNNLKDPKGREVGKLKQSILKFGFIAPFFIWEKGAYVLDGAGRNIALEMLEYEGHVIEDLPVVFIKAKNLDEAKEVVLAISSSYGDVTEDSWASFTDDMGLENLDLGFVELSGFDPSNLLADMPIPEQKSKKKITVEVTCPECGHAFTK